MRKLQILLPMLLLAMFGFAQQKIITGRITSKTTGEPLQKVSVSVLSKNRYTVTDSSGKFSVPATVGETIGFSFVGMNSIK